MKKLKLIGFTALLFFLSFFAIQAQEKERTLGVINGKDTLIYRELKEIWIYPDRKFDNRRQERDFWKYANKVRKVYPYAKTASELLRKYEPEYNKLTTQREKRKYIKKVEDELMAKYKDELKKLTISEGRILIKLVDRETSKTMFTLVKDFRGDFAAFFWQSLARLFGNNLKDEYDPYGEDRLTEEIVRMIEMGYI